MNEKFYRQFFLSKNEEGLLGDDHLQIRYSVLPQLLQWLDHFFNREGLKRASCIGIETSNRIEIAVLILYCLVTEINFYAGPATPYEDNSFPGFCDYILSFPAKIRHETELMKTLQVQVNPAFQYQAPALPALSSKVLFSTSGTSGKRKYVCFQADHLLENAKSCVERFQVQALHKILVPLPIGHMYGMGVGLLPAMLSGASLRLMGQTNLIKLLDQLKLLQPDLTLLTPALVRMVLILDKAFLLPGRYITAGERIEPESLKQFTNRYAPLINLYGCTELGAVATTLTSLGASHSDHTALYPLNGVEVAIDGKECGPLRCRHAYGFSFYVDHTGQQLSSLYANEPWYHTKDLAETKEKGFFISGRLDNAINRAGFLFSLEEVETAIIEHFEVVKTVVVFEAEPQNQTLGRLIAFCETEQNSALGKAELRLWCKQNLNKYLVPDEFHLVESLPRLHNGKPNRLSLINNFKSQLTTNNLLL